MINMENYEGYLFLYQEGELDSSTRAEVERFLLQHPDIREEMEQYYDPTLVVTAEPPVRQSRRVIPLWRWAAAACVVLALGYGAYLAIPQRIEGTETVAQITPDASGTITPLQEETPHLNHEQPAAIIAKANIKSSQKQPLLPEQAIETQQRPTSETIEPPQRTEVPILTTSIEGHPPVGSIIVTSTQLAEVNEIIMVDDLARVVPHAKPSDTPPFTYLAMKIRRNLENRRLEFEDFVYNIFAPKSGSNELAESN